MGVSDLTPAEVFAVGRIKPSVQDYEKLTFFRLIRNLGSMQGFQRTRIALQIVVIALAATGSHIGFSIPANLDMKGEFFWANWAHSVATITPSLVGLYYERYAPDIASGRGNRIFMVFWWILLQMAIATKPLQSIVYGTLGGRLLYVRVLIWVTFTRVLQSHYSSSDDPFKNARLRKIFSTILVVTQLEVF